MHKSDLILIGAFIITGVLLACLFLLQKPGNFAVVYVDGQRVEEYSLAEDVDIMVNGTNHFIIENKEAYLEDATCPDKLCVHMGHISKAGEMIICLPNRVMIVIEGTDSGDADVLSGGLNANNYD